MENISHTVMTRAYMEVANQEGLTIRGEISMYLIPRRSENGQLLGNVSTGEVQLFIRSSDPKILPHITLCNDIPDCDPDGYSKAVKELKEYALNFYGIDAEEVTHQGHEYTKAVRESNPCRIEGWYSKKVSIT